MYNENIINEKIISYIKKNRVSSTEVADALGKKGAVSGIQAINRGHFCVGNIFWAYAYGGSNWDIHEQIQNVKEGDVVFIETFECGDKAIFGELASKFLLLYKQAASIVVVGNLRDAHRLTKENWPIWCQGFNPIGCVNNKPIKTINPQVIKERNEIYNGGIAVCDDTGVVLIKKEEVNEELYKKLEFIEEQEDIWFDCIDRKKMTTFETVCLKKYL